MSIIKSFAVSDNNGEQGDMFYIKHGSSNFTIIDCCLNDTEKEKIVGEILGERKGKEITRFISTHPDEDHICGLKFLDDSIGIINFYCVKNQSTKVKPSESFKHYCKLRDGKHHYFVEKGCSRCWMNKNDETEGKNYGSSGINFLWPITSDLDYIDALSKAEEGSAYNNISPIFTYSIIGGVTIMWMGDIEHDFLEKIKGKINWPKIDILFAPHHGRKSGKVSSDVLKKLGPHVIIMVLSELWV